jgi:hypothetical protein
MDFFDWHLRRTRAEFFEEKIYPQNNLERRYVDSVFNADSKYVVSYDSSPIRSTEIG